jgi:predicted TIM-barrel fold metal-dependent hydrolase
MKAIGTTTTIFSLTTPGTTFLQGQAARDMTRQVNEYCARIRDSNPAKFGFFATLPSLLDNEGAIQEIKYALGTLRAEGVIVFTRYGEGNCYLGDPRLRPVWKELNLWKAVVLVHPENALRTLLEFVPQDHILFGSDYPYAPKPGALRMNDGWEEFPVAKDFRDKINYGNAESILPMFQKE